MGGFLVGKVQVVRRKVRGMSTNDRQRNEATRLRQDGQSCALEARVRVSCACCV
jgi:hypothetical protein